MALDSSVHIGLSICEIARISTFLKALQAKVVTVEYV